MGEPPGSNPESSGITGAAHPKPVSKVSNKLSEAVSATELLERLQRYQQEVDGKPAAPHHSRRQQAPGKQESPTPKGPGVHAAPRDGRQPQGHQKPLGTVKPVTVGAQLMAQVPPALLASHNSGSMPRHWETAVYMSPLAMLRQSSQRIATSLQSAGTVVTAVGAGAAGTTPVITGGTGTGVLDSRSALRPSSATRTRRHSTSMMPGQPSGAQPQSEAQANLKALEARLAHTAGINSHSQPVSESQVTWSSIPKGGSTEAESNAPAAVGSPTRTEFQKHLEAQPAGRSGELSFTGSPRASASRPSFRTSISVFSGAGSVPAQELLHAGSAPPGALDHMADHQSQRRAGLLQGSGDGSLSRHSDPLAAGTVAGGAVGRRRPSTTGRPGSRGQTGAGRLNPNNKQNSSIGRDPALVAAATAAAKASAAVAAAGMSDGASRVEEEQEARQEAGGQGGGGSHSDSGGDADQDDQQEDSSRRVQQQGLAADRQRALKPSGSQQARAHALAQVQQLHKLASASGQGSLEKSSWVGQPQSHGAGADGDSASSGQPAFWGGSGPARHQLLSEYVAQMAGRTSQTGGTASRPGTASSYWSSYDLEEGALEKAMASRQGSAVGKLRRSSSGRAPTAPGGVRSSSVGRPRTGPPGPLKKAVPYIRYLHPAVIMDLSLLTPALKPVPEVPLDDKGRPYPYVLPPTFPGAYPTIAFMGPAESKQAAGLHPLMRARMMVRYAGIANSPVKAAFKEAGWRVTKGKSWTVCWGHIFSAAEFSKLHEFQRVNHFPGTWELGRKDHLYRNVAALKRSKGDALDIVPRFYILPRDFDEFRSDLERCPSRLYIQKPVNSSRGRGVRMVVKPQELTREVEGILVQHYIANPYTINGYKFDMRIYVAATCFDPLRCFVYTDGLARFATEAYSGDKSDLKKRCMHLTNYSVNKKSAAFQANQSTDEEGSGSKWSLVSLRQHIEKDRGPEAWPRVWKQVHDIVAGAIIAAEPRMSTELRMKVPHRNICFEVWGFDILLDEDLRAWLIEANTCPALAGDTPLDKRVKTNMVADVMNMVGPVPYDADTYEEVQEARRKERLTGLSAGGGGRAGTQGGAAGLPSGASGPTSLQVPRTLREAEELEFRGLQPDQLPDIVIEAEAEYSRRRGWERVFPCPEDPRRYLDLFETPRASNIMLCKYYCQKAGIEFSAHGPPKQQNTGPPSTAKSKTRPTIMDWRPGGSAM